MKQILLLTVNARSVFVSDVSEIPYNAQLRYTHPTYNIYVEKGDVWSIAGREEEIRHAALVGIQARGLHAGDVRYVESPRRSRKRKASVSERQMPLWSDDD